MIERLRLLPKIAPFSDDALRLPQQALIAITRDGMGVGEWLVQLLHQQGYVQAMLVEELPAVCDMAVLLDGLQVFSSQQQAIAINARVFQQVQRIAKQFSEHGGRLITVQDTGGIFGLSSTHTWQPWAAGITGLIKTAALEWPLATCRAIDLQVADQTAQGIAQRLLTEIFQADDTIEIGLLADGRRICLETTSNFPHQTQIIPTTSSVVENNLPVILVTGGARGITAACITGLAQSQPSRFVLLGRTPLEDEPEFCQQANDETALKQALFHHYQAADIAVTPKQIQQQTAKILANREIRNTLSALQATGSQAQYLVVDVLDDVALPLALQDVRQQWGEIHGIIHGAGVLADKRITEKSVEQFTTVFNTKVIGLKNLLSATADDPLKLIVLFSSVAARFGNPGQCDYAMANEVLNKVAQQQQRLRQHCIVKALNWGPWEGGMVTPQLKQLFTERGVALIPIKDGVQRFVRECADWQNNANSSVQNDGILFSTVEIVIGGELNPQSKLSDDVQKSNAIPACYQLTIEIDARSHPYLAGHIIQEVPVIPACLVMEWFIHAARLHCPQLTITECKNFRVLRGIRLTDFYQKSQQLTITSTLSSDAQQLSLSLYPTGVKLPAYTADIPLISGVNNSPSPLFIDSILANAWPYTLHDIYDINSNPLALFHGKPFQVVTQLQTVSDSGGAADLKGIASMDWPGEWQLDVLAIDGAFQLLWLWGTRMLGKRSLPMAVKSLRVFKPCANTELHCVFHSEIQGDNQTCSRVILSDKNGQLYAEMSGVEMVCF